jgi:hypothetical protein
MSKRQRWYLMRREPGGLWFDACEAQGWDFDDAERRHDIYQEVLGRAVRFSEFTNSDFDLVKAHFLTLANDLKGAMEDGHPEIGEARRVRHVIKGMAPANYTAAIMRDKFHTTVLDDLDVSQLTQLRNTLAARSNKLRRRSKQPVRVEPAEVDDNVPF